jgi:hypothetical protein
MPSDNFDAGFDTTTNWTISIGTHQANGSGQVWCGLGGGNSVSFWKAGASAANHSSQVTVTTAGRYTGTAVRWTGTGGTACGYIVLTDGINIVIYRCDNGVFTAVSTGTATVANGDLVKLDVVGSALTAYVNGVSALTGSDATYASGAYGIYGEQTDSFALIDNWVGVDAASGALPFPVMVRQAVNRAATF